MRSFSPGVIVGRPPAGFEPAHMAPECTALHAFYLRERPLRELLGRV